MPNTKKQQEMIDNATNLPAVGSHILDEVSTTVDIQPTLLRLATQNAQLLAQDGSNEWPGSQPQYWYDSKLEGVPFVFAGEPHFAEKRSHFDHNKMQAVCRVSIHLFDDQLHRMPYPVQAEFTGAYILSSLTYLSQRWDAIRGLVYTLARDPQSEVNAITGKRSLNLKLYVHGADHPPVEDDPFVDALTPPVPGTPQAQFNQDRVAFLDACAKVHPVYRDARRVLQMIGVQSLIGVDLDMAYRTIYRDHQAHKTVR